MKNEPAISIVVPVYNVEKYLHACMKSLLAQTFTDFEVILVDDASPDNSGKICDEFAKKDARVRVVHLPENLGVTAARKAGIEVARGEWVSFVDSDDTLPANAMETLILGADDETDLVAGECLSIRGETKIPTEESNVLPPPNLKHSRHENFACNFCRAKFQRSVLGQNYFGEKISSTRKFLTFRAISRIAKTSSQISASRRTTAEKSKRRKPSFTITSPTKARRRTVAFTKATSSVFSTN